MFKFKGFRASLNFGNSSRKRRSKEFDNGAEILMNGAYRTNREEFFGYGSYSDTPKKVSPPQSKPVQQKAPEPAVRATKSTGDLSKPETVAVKLRTSNVDVSSDPRGGTTNNRDSTDFHRKPDKYDAPKDKKEREREIQKQKRAEHRRRARKAAQEKEEKERKKIEKQQQAEEKKREKLEAQDKAKKEKLIKDREKHLADMQAKEAKKKNKAPPAPELRTNPLAQNSAYTTNTLDSSISRNSGPPPYSEVMPNEKDNTGNTSFSKPLQNPGTSWDLISQHREQISRPVGQPVFGSSKPKQMVLDLQYNVGNNIKVDNSDA